MKIALLCQGNREIGLGHVTRCLWIAKALCDRSVSCEFVMGDDEVSRDIVSRQGFPFRVFQQVAEAPGIAAAVGADVVLSDCNEFGREEMVALASALPVVNIAVQGGSKWYAPVSYLHSPFMDTPKPPDADGVIHRGPEYAPLAPEFLAARERYQFRDEPQKLLIAMGGGDAMGYTLAAAEWMRDLSDLNLMLVFVLGAAYSDTDLVRKRLAALPQPCEILIAPDGLASTMAECDVALLAMGTTTYEACCIGLPSVNICPTPFHVGLAAVYHQRGMLMSSGQFDDTVAARVLAGLRRLVTHCDSRRMMHKCAREEVDGRGLMRVVEAVEAYARDGSGCGSCDKRVEL